MRNDRRYELSAVDEERYELHNLVERLMRKQENVGRVREFAQCAELIFDIQAFLAGRKTSVTRTAEEWIAYAENLLKP